MQNKIIEIISQITKISANELLENLETERMWSSIDHVEVVIALEEEFDVSFDQEEIAQMKTISKICELIKGKV